MFNVICGLKGVYLTEPLSTTERDTPWMLRALELARNGIALCSPNPTVGCVILDREGALAGEGWHEYDRLDHAEVVAIRNAGTRAQGRDGLCHPGALQPHWPDWTLHGGADRGGCARGCCRGRSQSAGGWEGFGETRQARIPSTLGFAGLRRSGSTKDLPAGASIAVRWC